MSNNLKKRIMVRVYVEYTKSAVVKYQDYLMLGIFVIVSLTLVSIQDVLINAGNISRTNLPSLFSFFTAALKNTSWMMQILIAGLFVRIIFLGAKLTYRNMNSNWTRTKLFRLKY